MKRRTHRVRRQVLLFPAGAKGEAAPPDAKSAIVQVLADLLLEALRAESDAKGDSDEPEDHS